MPNRSVILPVMTPPRPKPNKIMVAASDTAPRVAANSCCTTGITTTTDHIPTAPTEAISTASASRSHAWRESGVKAGESVWAEVVRARAATSPPAAPVKPHGAILGMQMQGSRKTSRHSGAMRSIEPGIS